MATGCCGRKGGCGETFSAAQVDDLKTSALGFGFDPSWVSDLLTKWGPAVLALVVEGVRLGFNKEFVVEILSKFGPVVLEFLIGLFNKQNMKFHVAGDVVDGNVVGEETGLMISLIERFLPQLLEKYLPMLVDKYKDQFVQALIDAVLSVLKK